MSTFNILSVVTGVRYFSQNVNIIASFKFIKKTLLFVRAWKLFHTFLLEAIQKGSWISSFGNFVYKAKITPQHWKQCGGSVKF